MYSTIKGMNGRVGSFDKIKSKIAKTANGTEEYNKIFFNTACFIYKAYKYERKAYSTIT